MSDLQFIEDGHIYLLDGRPVPSVTDICSLLTAREMAAIPPHVLQSAARRGTIIHEMTEMIDYGADPAELEMVPEIGPYISAYLRFLRDYTPRWDFVEHRMASREYGFAGTADRIGLVDGERWVLDIKNVSTVSRITKIAWAAQLSGYETLACMGPLRRFNLLLRPGGRYTLYDAAKSEEKLRFSGESVFWQALTLYSTLKG